MNLINTTLKRRLFVIFFILFPYTIFARIVSPIEFGLLSADSGEERYFILYDTHVYALSHNTSVSYIGLKDIYLTIPKGAKSIPLGAKTDFNGCTFHVLNNEKDDFALFELMKESERIDARVDSSGNILYNKKKGNYLFIITDKEPWIYERQGFGYSEIRKDIHYFSGCNSRLKTIAPYTERSLIGVEVVRQGNDKKSFRNIYLRRDVNSTKKTLLLRVQNIYNLTIQNIQVDTPENEFLFGDAIITIRNCVKVKLQDIVINGTYSFIEKYGYAFAINNVSQLEAKAIQAKGRWGVFCCYNLNGAVIKNSTINRFDIHSYGRDFYFEKCCFTKTGLPMSSFYGNAVFRDCIFDNAISIIYRVDYNAYTPFDVNYTNCIFKLDERHNYIIDLAKISSKSNARLELAEKNLPNITMNNCEFVVHDDVKVIDVIKNCVNAKGVQFGYISNILFTNLKSNKSDLKIKCFDYPLTTKKQLSIQYITTGKNSREIGGGMLNNLSFSRNCT